MSGESPIVGIDLGTTNSSVAIFRDGAVRVIPNALGEPLTPSVVAHDERSSALVVGRTAKDIYALRPDLGAALFKRAMGTDRGYRIAGKEYGAVELSALVLRSLRRDAETALGTEVNRAVVTVPAYFNDAQRYATLKAGELAGLDVERILNEPTAAAIAHGLHARMSEGTILVFDLGGGTFDVCLMERFEGSLEVRSVAGESMLGGEDFTVRLAAHALERAGASFERAEARDPEATLTLIKRAELLKRRLLREGRGTITVPRIPGLVEEELRVELSLAEADRVFEPLVRRLAGPCRQVFLHAGLNREDVDELILVGGGTRLGCVRDFAIEHLHATPLDGVDPDLAVVHGAAVQAALYSRDEHVEDLVVTDVASHSLGIETTKRFGGSFVPGFFLPIIHRNSVIPTSRSEVVETLEPNQKRIVLAVYEGEARRVEDNRPIGTLLVDGLPRGPVQEVDVRFTYDLNGILEVEATVRSTGEKHVKVFSRDSEVLSEDRIAAARTRLARLKEDPRKQPRLRDLIARAEALIAEAGRDERPILEHALDELEDALAERDRVRASEAVAFLEALCERLDGGDRW